MQDAKLLKPIAASLAFLRQKIIIRLKSYFDASPDVTEIPDISLPQFNGQQTPFIQFLNEHQLSEDEFLLLLIALAPHVQADFFERIIQEHIPKAGDFPQFGGARGKQFRGMLPTGETALFILAGHDLERRFQVQHLFQADHFFVKKRILLIEEPPAPEPKMCGKLVLSPEYIELFTLGKVSPPTFSMRFPAQLIETKLEWKDLVLNDKTMHQIKELETWVKHGKTLLTEWGMGKRLKPGYRVLFYGPPGTGKTFTASLLGKYTDKHVYRVDLSMVVSKYIGETEKNLSNLFARAENKDWILFFDEADALFGKRTSVRDAHDKYANQEVAYLLQRVEGYNGLVILASNFKSNIDDAFMRRFQSVVHFPQPKSSERLRLWKKSFPDIVTLSENIDLSAVARKYELTGSGIINVVQYCCLEALGRGEAQVTLDDIIQGIRKEFLKEGKIIH